ncbi:hypothetical protein TL16_g12587 [Triparma laevis f. inornata]|uniref:Uncharacterized protein n=2 Tax=Triparma laevis TaxID=1534972 RepID=A0A9W7BV31_9STRA|nr:hypothetical protein TL16_g12587 [Triparma laevis f. inornata]
MQRHFTVREIVNRGTLIFHNLSLDSRSGIEVRRSLIMNNSIQLLQETHRYWKEDNHILGYTQETLYRLFSALNEDPNLKEEYNIMYYEKRREEEKRRGEEQGPVCDF